MVKPGSGGIDLYSAVSSATAGVADALGSEAASVVLWGGGGPESEVLRSHDVPAEVDEALGMRGGSYLTELVRSSGGPVRIFTESLPDETDVLRAALYQHSIGALAAFPLYGESGVTGCLAAPLADPARVPRSERSGWRLACRTLQGVQLAAGTAALRVALAGDRRRPPELSEGVLVVDSWDRVMLADGLIRTLCSPGRDPFGCPVDSLPCADVLSSLPESAAARPEWQERSLAGPDGSPVPVALASSRLGPDDGAVEGGRIIFLRDLRDDRPGAVDPTARMLALGMRVTHVADVLSHAIRTGRKRSEGFGVSPWLVEAFEREIADAGHLVRRVLERCRPGEDRTTVQLNHVLDEVLIRYQDRLDEEDIKLFVFTNKELPSVPGDPLALLRALRIMVQGSWEALSPGGGTLTTRTWSDDTWVYSAVSNDGAGERGASVGEPLFPVAEDARAAGMEAVREIVERSGGRLIVESRPGVWSRATIMLRKERRRGPRPGRRPRVEAEEESPRGLGVLVVDDNAALRSVLRRFLERRGHAVSEAEDGVEGLEVVKKQNFDRLIVDIQMPNKDGLEFYADLQGVEPELQAKTIFVTGGFLSESAERFIRESGRPSVRKPFDLEKLASTVEA